MRTGQKSVLAHDFARDVVVFESFKIKVSSTIITDGQAVVHGVRKLKDKPTFGGYAEKFVLFVYSFHTQYDTIDVVFARHIRNCIKADTRFIGEQWVLK